MAAIDPSAVPQIDDDNKALRATLKIIRAPMDEDDDEDDDEDYDEDDDDIEAIKARLRGIISDEDMSEDDDSEDEKNGGPSDPAKSKKAKQAALTKKLQEELDEDIEMDESFTNGVNGKSKGKGKALDDEEIDSDDESIDSDDDDDEVEEFVLCTLDPERVSSSLAYQSRPC
jgi:FK506-binding nuclear protein